MATNRSRQALIAGIIQQRKPFLTEIVRIQAALAKRATALKSLERVQAGILSSGQSPLVEEVRNFNFAALRTKVERMRQELEKPKARFARDTLNIGVIGRARQGKSRLLQSLSGLNTAVIPTGSTGHCTGVRSLICHDPSRTPHGEITFYSEQEFLSEVIAPYCQALGLGAPPISLDDFDRGLLLHLPTNLPNQGYAMPAEQYRHLKEYKDNLHEYRPLIGKPVLGVKVEQIREYVAQDTPDGRGRYFKYMAVKEAKIICGFQHPDVGQIALVDMPGLGDTGIGAEDRLVRALGEHTDVVLFVLMPSPVGGILQDHDFSLYDLAYRSLEGLPVERWSFMTLNHTKPPSMPTRDNPVLGDNIANCKRIRDNIQNGRVGFNERRINVVDCLIADCSNPDEAKDVILERVLQYLVGEMVNLDREYLSSWGKRLGALQAEIATELQKAQGALSIAISRHGDTKIFHDLFDILWRELTTGLEDLMEEVQRLSADRRTTIFAEYFKKTLDECRRDTALPSKEDFRGVRHELGAYVNAYNKFLDQMRTNLTHHFVDMDDNLKVKMDEVKRLVVGVLLNKGRLRNLAKDIPEADFLLWMARHPSLTPRLQKAFQMLNDYELSFRGFFQSRIRATLTNMMPDLTTKRPTMLTAHGTTAVANVDETIALLRAVHKETVDQLEQVLDRFAYEPSMAAQAIIEEFVDQVLRARDADKGWRVFYQTEKEKVWAAEFANVVKWEERQKMWQGAVRQALEANTADSLQFLSVFTQHTTTL